MKSNIWLFVLGLFLFQACSSDDPVGCVGETVEAQASVIDDYVSTNNLTLQTTTSGMRYVINTPGTGDNVQLGDIIEVAFEGFFLDGTSFTQGVFDPFEFGTLSLIPGFAEALTLLNEGAQGTFILPTALGYGCFPPQGGGIPENAIVIFEITMVAVNP